MRLYEIRKALDIASKCPIKAELIRKVCRTSPNWFNTADEVLDRLTINQRDSLLYIKGEYHLDEPNQLLLRKVGDVVMERLWFDSWGNTGMLLVVHFDGYRTRFA